MSVSTIDAYSSPERYIGCVKWFNNKAGFGFITLIGDNQKDVFVHWSSIKVENSQYKYLVQGEYVEFEIVKPEGDKHEFHAIAVSGIKGGNLMCETIRLARDASNIARAERATLAAEDKEGAQQPAVANKRNPAAGKGGRTRAPRADKA
jgi:CspA family cold shock protein